MILNLTMDEETARLELARIQETHPKTYQKIAGIIRHLNQGRTLKEAANSLKISHKYIYTLSTTYREIIDSLTKFERPISKSSLKRELDRVQESIEILKKASPAMARELVRISLLKKDGYIREKITALRTGLQLAGLDSNREAPTPPINMRKLILNIFQSDPKQGKKILDEFIDTQPRKLEDKRHDIEY